MKPVCMKLVDSGAPSQLTHVKRMNTIRLISDQFRPSYYSNGEALAILNRDLGT